MGEITVGADIQRQVQEHSTSIILLGVGLLLLGVLTLFAPLMAGVAIAVLVGMFVLAAGVVRSVFAFKARSWGSGIFGFVVGIVCILGGLYLLLHPLLNLLALSVFLAAYFIVDGAFVVFFAFRLRPIKGWAWMLFGGVMSIVLGLLIWVQWPASGAWSIGILVGIYLVFGGWSLIGIGFEARVKS
jgi:uncharacterized membrane protein HdeD (DUF308 family)